MTPLQIGSRIYRRLAFEHGRHCGRFACARRLNLGPCLTLGD